MFQPQKLNAAFFKTDSDAEPVKEWLKALPTIDKKAVGADIRTIQFSWPLGMPLVRKIDTNLWESRSKLTNGIARVFFTVKGNTIILLHGFIKKISKNTYKRLISCKRTS